MNGSLSLISRKKKGKEMYFLLQTMLFQMFTTMLLYVPLHMYYRAYVLESLSRNKICFQMHTFLQTYTCPVHFTLNYNEHVSDFSHSILRTAIIWKLLQLDFRKAVWWSLSYFLSNPAITSQPSISKILVLCSKRYN